MPGTKLKEFLEKRNKVDSLCNELINLLEESSNPAFEKWDDEQKSNRAVMLESCSLVFSVLVHVETISTGSRSSLIREVLDDFESVDSELFFQATMSLLEAANRAGDSSVDVMIVEDLVRDLRRHWKTVWSSEDRAAVRGYITSEKSLYFIKNKLSPAQVGKILTDITKDDCPFRDAVPKVILVPMEAISTTTKMVSWIEDSSVAWMSNVWPVAKPEVHKRRSNVGMAVASKKKADSVKADSAPFSNIPESRKAEPAKQETPEVKRGVEFGLKSSSMLERKDKKAKRDDEHKKDKKLKKEKDEKKDLKETRNNKVVKESVKKPEPNKENPGIVMFPIPSGKSGKPGVAMGPYRLPPARMNFQVHGNSPFRRMAAAIF